MVPIGKVSSGKSVLAIGPRIISLVLLVFSCMSFLTFQASRLSKKIFMLELWDFGCRTSDKVESSTYLTTGQPVDK